jgi:hypothetical protein
VKSGAGNPIGKLTSIINAMTCGADSIDDANVLRAGGTPHLTEELPVHADDLAEFGGDRSLCIKAMIEKVVDRMYVWWDFRSPSSPLNERCLDDREETKPTLRVHARSAKNQHILVVVPASLDVAK